MKYIMLILVNLVLTIILLRAITHYKIVLFNGFHFLGGTYSYKATLWLEIIINCLIFSPLIILTRKCSSLIPYLIVFVPYFLLDLYIESHYRCCNQDSSRALWNYYNDSIISMIKIPVLKFFVTTIRRRHTLWHYRTLSFQIACRHYLQQNKISCESQPATI